MFQPKLPAKDVVLTTVTHKQLVEKTGGSDSQIRKLLKDALAKGIMEQRQFRIRAGDTTRPIMHFKKREGRHARNG